MQDADGNEVGVGDVVRVLSVDSAFLESLTDEEKTHHVAMVGSDYVIDEIVDDGLKASVSIEWEIEDGIAIGGLYMLANEFRLTRRKSS
jgi:hypothetical protein